MASAAVSDEGALRMRPTPCGCTSARLSEFTGTAVFNSNTVTVAPRAYFFWLVRKSMHKETLETNRIVPQATEESRKRTMRPAHGNLPTNLHYSAACVETTLPSGVVATQGNGKTRCCGMQNASTYVPVVHNICRADVGIGPYKLLCRIVTAQVFRK